MEKENAIHFMQTPLGRKVSWSFFKEYTLSIEVSKFAYKGEWEDHLRRIRSREKNKKGEDDKTRSKFNRPIINEYLNHYREGNFIETKIIKKRIKQYGKEIDHPYLNFRLSSDVFVFYFNKNLKEKVSTKEKKALKALLDIPEIRFFIYEWFSLKNEEFKFNIFDALAEFFFKVVPSPELEQMEVYFRYRKDLLKKYIELGIEEKIKSINYSGQAPNLKQRYNRELSSISSKLSKISRRDYCNW